MLKYWPVKALILLFIAPMLGATYLLSHKNVITSHSVQHGNLIQPAQQILDSNLIANKWNIVYVRPENCADTCKQQEQTLKNLHIALGPEQDRVAIVTAGNNILRLKPTDGSILLINPSNFYIMQYDPEANLSGLLKDLKRLLKYSHARKS